MKTLWMDNRLTTACQNGDTLIYDGFPRSSPEANNALLSIRGERILNLPKLRRSGQGYLEVHPEFRAIFTSNPEEYAGVHKTQDALMDRLITITLGHYDRATEIAVTVAKSGVPEADAEAIVDIVRELRGVGVNNHRPTIRACIAIGRILAHRRARAPARAPRRRRRRSAKGVRRWPSPERPCATSVLCPEKSTGSPTRTWPTCRSPAWRWRR